LQFAALRRTDGTYKSCNDNVKHGNCGGDRTGLIDRHRDSNLDGLWYHLVGSRGEVLLDRLVGIVLASDTIKMTTDERPAKIELDEEG
jgi:hypothetical protein